MSLNAYESLTHRGEDGAPTVFAFHGTGGNERQFFELARQILPEATVVSPRGDVSEHGALRFFRRTGEGVYDMDDLAARTAKMADYIAAHRDAGTGPVYAFGYSNGANILAAVLLSQPGLIDRAALLHPLVPWQPLPQPAVASTQVLITAGENDPICPWPLSAALISYFQAQGSSVVTDIHPGGHELRPTELAALKSFLQRDS